MGANLQRLCEDGEPDMQAEVAGAGERVFIYFNGFIGRLSNTENTGSAYPTAHRGSGRNVWQLRNTKAGPLAGLPRWRPAIMER